MLQQKLAARGYAVVVGGVEIEMAPNDFDIRLRENIQSLLSKSELRDGTPAFGIATQILSQGFHSLSWKQRFAYLEELAPKLRQHGLKMGQEWKGESG